MELRPARGGQEKARWRRSAAAGRWIRLLSPLVPVIYLDIVIDGCLKGLGQMMRSMRYNLSEAAIGLILAGLLNGGARDVFAKAVRICTECVGLG